MRVRTRRNGLSLLEVMLALAILGGALAVIGELTRLGARSAETARDLTKAQRFCENKMAEISTGLITPQAIALAPLEELEGQPEEEDWAYTIELEQLPQTGLLGIWVTVEQRADRINRPVSFTLARWMIDPQFLQTMSSATAGTTGSTSETTGGSSGAMGASSSSGSAAGGTGR